MAKEEGVEVEGTVIERLRNARFRVSLSGGHLVLAYVSGKMRRFAIKILEGDTVIMVLSVPFITMNIPSPAPVMAESCAPERSRRTRSPAA